MTVTRQCRGATAVAVAGSAVAAGGAATPVAAASTGSLAQDAAVTPDPGEVNIEDVPDISAEWYLDVAGFAHSTPSWLQDFAALFTEAVIVLLGALLLLSWWRARRHSARTMALALLAPVATVVAYLVSEYSKTLLEAHRPCQTFTGIDSLVRCPPVGDWSFPSNHSTIAGAVAVGVILAWPRMGFLAAPLAALAAYSRVFVGAHYPHDVVAGLLLGAIVATIVSLALARLITALVRRLREHRVLGVLLVAGTSGPATGQVDPDGTNRCATEPIERAAAPTDNSAEQTLRLQRRSRQ